MLGRGRSGVVYLAKHIELDEYRAIKQVPKTCTDYEQFRREALILKQLRHTGIPIVYDLEEDDQCSYLIEEFLEGDSLYALVSDMGHFSTAMTISYGIQICHLVSVLHSAKPNPILYLDLQPKNLLISNDIVKLIDFDHAVSSNEAAALDERYGTIGCAAPEQYTSDPLDERTDIYAIGAVLYYMLTGTLPKKELSFPRGASERRLARIIRTCLLRRPEKRYQSVTQLADALQQIQTEYFQQKYRGVFGKEQISSLTIAVAGTKAGVGTTHIALGLTAHMRRCGFSAVYEEQNASNAALQFGVCMGKTPDSYGIYLVKGVPMLPLYGSNVKLPPHPYPVVVKDYGHDWQTLLCEESEADHTLLVCGTKPWEYETTKEVLCQFSGRSELTIIYNQFAKRYRGKAAAPDGKLPCFLMPHDADSRTDRERVRAVYDALLASWKEVRPKGRMRRLFGIGKHLRKKRM